MTAVDVLIIVTGGILIGSGVGLAALVGIWKHRGEW